VSGGAAAVTGVASGGVGVWSVPGRVNLIGEHTDYNEGFVLPLALTRRLRCTATRRDDRRLVARSAQQPGLLDVLEPEPGRLAGWGVYPAGVVWALRASGHDVGGLELNFDGNLPPGAGLSSSAAVCCAVAMACNDLFSLGLDRVGLARAAQLAENGFVGVPTGIMDQLAVLCGRARYAMLLDTRSLELQPVPLLLAERGLTLLVIDTGAARQLAGGEYAGRRRACERAAAALGVPALRDVTDLVALDRLTDAELRRRARHVITENARVLAVAELLAGGGDPREIGPALTASHESLRDDFAVSSPELDAAVDAALAAGAHGARLTGGGFGGCAIALVDAGPAHAVAESVWEAFDAHGFAPPSTFAAAAAAGATRLT
jgi:galactokinase